MFSAFAQIDELEKSGESHQERAHQTKCLSGYYADGSQKPRNAEQKKR